MVNTADVSPRAKAAFERLQSGTDSKLSITSGYRDPEYNERVGGAKNSQHIHGNAYDISTAGMSQGEIKELVRKARAAGFSGIGVYNNSVHFDTGPSRYWGPTYGKESAPPWLEAMMSDVPVGQYGDEDHGDHDGHEDEMRKPDPAPWHQRLAQNDQGAWTNEDGTPMH